MVIGEKGVDRLYHTKNMHNNNQERELFKLTGMYWTAEASIMHRKLSPNKRE